MNDRKKLLRQIQVFSFAVYESALYLDGHPKDKRAIEFYNKYKTRLAELSERYEKNFGPLTIFGNCAPEWKWVDGPWPWEYDCD